jgi:hypothetical protein
MKHNRQHLWQQRGHHCLAGCAGQACVWRRQLRCSNCSAAWNSCGVRILLLLLLRLLLLQIHVHWCCCWCKMSVHAMWLFALLLLLLLLLRW